MATMQEQYLSACPGLDRKTISHRHSFRCRQVRVARVELREPFDVDGYVGALLDLALIEAGSNEEEHVA